MASIKTNGRKARRRGHVIAFGLIALVFGAYLALPLFWKHYEHRKGLEGREMFTRTKQGIPGDPINFGLIGADADVFCAFKAAGWFPANPVTLASSLKIADSVVRHKPYATAPVSPLFYEGRPEDLAFELPVGDSADTRHHVRLWKVNSQAGPTDDPRPLWLASSSFDKGVGVSHYTLRVTHHIDGDLDAERGFIASALAKTGLTTSSYEVSGVGPTVNGHNGGGDRYYTDGEVVVETLNTNCKAVPGPAPKPLTNPWQVHLKNQIWRALRPLMRGF